MEESTRGRGRPRGRPARGARATRGGRGAARGAAAAASEPEPTPTPAVDTAMADAPPAEAFPSLAAASEASTSQTNTAAPPLPTENATPAAEPSRSASPAVRGASSTRASAARGAPRGGRFLPRAIRRSALDREAIARDVQLKMEDQERQNARLKMRGRGGRGGRRARGGPVNFGAVIRGGGGGFGSNIVTATGGRGGGFGSFGAAGGFGSTGAAGRAGGGDGGGPGFTYRKGMKIEEASQFDSTSRATGPRMNTDSFAERVHQQPETDSKEKVVPLPMGIRRVDSAPAETATSPQDDEDEVENKEEPVPISDDSSELGDVFHNENEEMTDNGQKWVGASDRKTVKIEDEEFNEIDRLTQRLAMNPAKVRKQKALKNMDWEDRYHDEKMQTQRLLFGVDSDDEDEPVKPADVSEESQELTETKQPRRKPLIQDGELYIFQFPPVMPPLRVSRPARDPAATKKSPVKDEPDDDVAMADAAAPAPKGRGKAVDLTARNEDEGADEEANGSGSKKKAPDGGSSGKMEDQPSGFLGKLNVHKSGKISLDYGGMLFDVEMAIPISHAREAVLIVDHGENPDKDGYHGTAYGMGRIAGKFNAVPHWSSVKPWNVDPKELPPWGCEAAPEGTLAEGYAHLLKREKTKQQPLPPVDL